MKISKICINNFRLLKDVELSLEGKTTVIVGRNNSGKISLVEPELNLHLTITEPALNLQRTYNLTRAL